eukprot:7245250-Prorocentrum_lima.AAC.1
MVTLLTRMNYVRPSGRHQCCSPRPNSYPVLSHTAHHHQHSPKHTALRVAVPTTRKRRAQPRRRSG